MTKSIFKILFLIIAVLAVWQDSDAQTFGNCGFTYSSCMNSCASTYQQCVNEGDPEVNCEFNRDSCESTCGSNYYTCMNAKASNCFSTCINVCAACGGCYQYSLDEYEYCRPVCSWGVPGPGYCR